MYCLFWLSRCSLPAPLLSFLTASNFLPHAVGEPLESAINFVSYMPPNAPGGARATSPRIYVRWPPGALVPAAPCAHAAARSAWPFASTRTLWGALEGARIWRRVEKKKYVPCCIRLDDSESHPVFYTATLFLKQFSFFKKPKQRPEIIHENMSIA